MDALQAHYSWQLCGGYDPKEVDILGRGLGKPIGSLEIPPAAPALLHLMNVSAQEVSRGIHLSKLAGQVIWPLLLKVRLMGLVIGSPGHPHNFWIFGEGLMAGFLKGLYHQPSLFPFLVRTLFGNVVRFHCFLFFLPLGQYTLVWGMALAFGACWWCLHLQHSWDGGHGYHFSICHSPQLDCSQHPEEGS